MKIVLERQTLLKKLLVPIAKVTESCILSVNPTEIHTIATSENHTIILYLSLPNLQNSEIKQEVILNIPNVRKLLQVIECITDPFVELKIESNYLAYTSPKIKFKYFLLDDGVIAKPPIDIAKINNLTFDCDFELTSKVISELNKGSSFTADTNKIYFYTKDSGVFAELSDQTLQNTDSITFQVADKFGGTKIESSLPLNMDVIRLVGSLKADLVKVNINTNYKVFLFEISDNDHIIKFIVSALIK